MEGVDRADIISAAEEEAFQEEVNIAKMILLIVVCCHWPSLRPRRLQLMFMVFVLVWKKTKFGNPFITETLTDRSLS